MIGGADFSSNVALSRSIQQQPKGTHAHSMVQVFIARGGTELEAFQAYADLYPDDCLLLVDTIDTLQSGVPNAIKVFEQLKRKGHRPLGIRLDSGDLAYLSIQSAKMLDDAGFEDTAIVLSNQLDEMVLWQIQTQIHQEAPRYGVDPEQLIKRLTYGVGTRLITSAGQSALDGVYKLVALEGDRGFIPAIKISENPEKIPNPGNKNVWRIYDLRGKADADLLCLDDETPLETDPLILYHPIEHRTRRQIPQKSVSNTESLLIDVLKDGRLIYEFPTLEAIRERRQEDIQRLDPGVRRVVNPHVYHVSLSERLRKLKQSLTQQVLEGNHSGSRAAKTPKKQ
jgi:nicotinate phosphoribosyltransferase